MFDAERNEQSAPSSGEAPVERSPGWHERAGLTIREAEELLDWLEAHGVTRREALVTPEGTVVRWQG